MSGIVKNWPSDRPPLLAPIERWDEAIPLGNGLLGGLLWGGSNIIKLSLDRGDLWDLRMSKTLRRPDWNYATIRKLVAEKNHARMVELFDRPYDKEPFPTKIPAGRIELLFSKRHAAGEFQLDLRRAEGRVRLHPSGAEIAVFFSAATPVAMIRVTGAPVRWRMVPPPYSERSKETQTSSLATGSLGTLGYPPPQHGKAGAISWFQQDGALGLRYAVVAAVCRRGRQTEIALAITSTDDGPDPLACGRERVLAAIESGYDRMLRAHARWWTAFWAQSSLHVPDVAVQQHYELTQYFYGSASRRGAPPITLQGVWTADEGKLPPWKGDYHNDLNTQLTYWAYPAANHLDEGLSFLDFMWKLLPQHRQFARSFYGKPGAAIPGVMTLDGKPMGGWSQYSLSPTNGAWVAHMFYLHWQHTRERSFLAERAYPYCAAIAECLAALLEPSRDGKRHLPLSSSPEVHDNTMRAWLAADSTYDLSLMRWLFAALTEMAEALADRSAAKRWRSVLNRLEPLAVGGADGAGPLLICRGEPLAESHRHFSHLMAIYPLGTLHIEGTDRDRRIIDQSLRQIDRLGTGFWCGYSFSWMSCMAARCGMAERAGNMLDLYLRGFVSRNGFHLNGDFKRLGLSAFDYRPFTLEGNFAAAQAVHEMLLQGWGGVIRVFPATPGVWKDVAFHNLRTEGAFRVSARREKGRTISVRIQAGCAGVVRLRNPFGEEKIRWNRHDVKRTGQDFKCRLAAGAVLEGKIENRDECENPA